MKEKFLPCIKNSLRFAVIFTFVYSFMGEVVRFSSETGKILYFITFRNFVTAFFVSFLRDGNCKNAIGIHSGRHT